VILINSKKEKEKLNKALHSGQVNRKVHKEKMQSLELKINETRDMLQLLEHTAISDDDIERLYIETALARAQKQCLLELGKKKGSKSAILEEYKEKVDTKYMAMKLEQSSKGEEKE
jgi:hypothetical protein